MSLGLVSVCSTSKSGSAGEGGTLSCWLTERERERERKREREKGALNNEDGFTMSKKNTVVAYDALLRNSCPSTFCSLAAYRVTKFNITT